MSNEITVDRDFFEHLLNCMEKQKHSHPNSQGRYVGVNEPYQEMIDTAYHKARALLTQNTVQPKEPFNYQEGPIPGHTYTLTWDPAKRPDFSVITVVGRDTGHVVVFDYGNLSDYRSQAFRAVTLAFKYNNASITWDPTGVGSPLVEELRALGVAVLEKVL